MKINSVVLEANRWIGRLGNRARLKTCLKRQALNYENKHE
jgi:hypothetical protein